jgi:hypothetical protein
VKTRNEEGYKMGKEKACKDCIDFEMNDEEVFQARQNGLEYFEKMGLTKDGKCKEWNNKQVSFTDTCNIWRNTPRDKMK